MKRNTILIVVCASVVLVAVCVCIAVIVVFHGIPQGGQQHGVWDNVRLPTSLTPSVYDVHIRSDFVNFAFSGFVSIDVRCDEDTDVVVLHCLELDIKDVSVTLPEAPHPTWDSNPPLKGKPWQNEKNEFLVFKLVRPLVKGTLYTIHVNFSGPLEQDYIGYFATPYETSTGTRWVGSTQLAVPYARRAFPCFDEPALKARFLLTLEHIPEYQAISNMPLVSKSTLEDGWTRSKFNESVPMSTYLMAWSVFDFVNVEKTTGDGVLFRVWTRPDAINEARYALERGADIIDFYGEYFGTKFPLPKMDFVAVPGYQIIAMENWGMNVFEPAKFLFKEDVTTSNDQLTICAWIAHELAHQWFGNLVTFEWWDDLWLNEGFASYVEYLGTNYTEPDWNIMDMFMWRDKYPVLLTDSLVTSRPISMSVLTNDEIFQQFDWISYNKGASILRMLSNFLGENTFRKGLKSYLETFAYNNTDKDGLWMQLNEAATNDGKGHLNVKEIMDTWTLQMGYPVVTVNRRDSKEGVYFIADQERFLLNPDQPVADKHRYLWHIPLTFTTSRHLQFDNPPQEWLTPDGGTMQLPLEVQDNDWLLANVESRGYYRVNYDLRNWALITEQLMTAVDVIPPASRSTLINDAFNLARSGYLDPVIALNLTRYLTNERDFVPWASVEDVMGFLEAMLRDTSAHSDLKSYMLQLLTPLYEYVDWNDPGTFRLRRLQAVIMQLACAYGHPDCSGQSHVLYNDWKYNNGTSNKFGPDASLAVFCTAIALGDKADWEFAFNRYQTTNSDTEKLTLLSGMTCSTDSEILKRYLSYLLGIDVISDAHHERVLSGILANEAGTELAWNFFWENYDTLFKIHGDNFFNFIAMATSLTSTLNSEDKLAMLKSELAKNPNQSAARRTFTQGVEITEANIRWMQNNYDSVASWLKEQQAGR